MAKRVLDFGVVLVGLLLFLPFGLAIVALLLVTGEGKVFFVQERVGRGNRTFGIVKFATMLKDSPSMPGGTLTLKDDPRVLPVGRFLRKSKLNEVPQLWNVLRGDMSLIGPRPQVREHLDMYAPGVREQILTLRPGISGIGSIAFRDEEELLGSDRAQADANYLGGIVSRKGELEHWYVVRQGFWLDLLLLQLTVIALVSPRSELYRKLLRDLPDEVRGDGVDGHQTT